MTHSGVSHARRRTLAVLAVAAVAVIGVAIALPASAADHDRWGWRDGYWGPVFGYSFAAPPYGYYYPAYGPYPGRSVLLQLLLRPAGFQLRGLQVT